MLSGRMAVMGFYVISGFLITGVLDQKYGAARGRLLFIVNRFLRLYPLYCVISIQSYLCYAWIGPVPVDPAIPADKWIPANATLNAFIPVPSLRTSSFGTPLLLGGSGAIPQGWSVSVELSFYAFAVAAAFINLKTCLQITFAVSMSLFLLSVVWMDSFSTGYDNGIYKDAFSTLWLFCAGGLTYFYRSKNGRLRSTRAFATSLAGLAFLMLGIFCNRYLGELIATNAPFWKPLLIASQIVTAAAVVAVIVNAPAFEAPFSKWLGDLSYGMYLNHLLIAWALLYIASLFSVQLFGRLNTLAFGVVALFTSAIVAYVMHQYIDRPLGRIRGYVRKIATPSRSLA